MNPGLIVAFVAGVLLLYLIAKIFVVPIKFIGKLLINAVIGGILLWILDYFGAYIGLRIPINPITALIAGALGVPGILLLIALQFLMYR